MSNRTPHQEIMLISATACMLFSLLTIGQLIGYVDTPQPMEPGRAILLAMAMPCIRSFLVRMFSGGIDD